MLIIFLYLLHCCTQGVLQSPNTLWWFVHWRQDLRFVSLSSLRYLNSVAAFRPIQPALFQAHFLIIYYCKLVYFAADSTFESTNTHLQIAPVLRINGTSATWLHYSAVFCNLSSSSWGIWNLHYIGLLKMIVWVLTTFHTQYTWDSSICIFLFNRTTLQVFVTHLTGALYVHPLWFYKHQHDNPVRSTQNAFSLPRRHLSKLCSKRRNA